MGQEMSDLEYMPNCTRSEDVSTNLLCHLRKIRWDSQASAVDLGTYGKVSEGHKPVPSLWAFALIDCLSYIVTLC